MKRRPKRSAVQSARVVEAVKAALALTDEDRLRLALTLIGTASEADTEAMLEGVWAKLDPDIQDAMVRLIESHPSTARFARLLH